MPSGKQSLSASSATWWELADSVYLASVIGQHTHDHPAQQNPAEHVPEPPRPPKEQPPPPVPGEEHEAAATHTPPVSSHAVEAEPDSGPEAPAEPDLRLVRGEAISAVPQASLPASALVRALWPLKRKVRSWREDDLVFDAEATAERAAYDGQWWPMTKPDTQRLFDLTVVVDASPSMTLWRRKLTTFLTLLERRGAFRSIQIRMLDTRTDPGGTPVLRGGTMQTPTRGAGELRDPSRRRMVLVLTDGINNCWRQDLVGPMLARWGRTMQVCVVSLLSERLWGRTGMPVERVRLGGLGALAPNRKWTCEFADAWVLPKEAATVPEDTVPVPVIELEPRWLGWWARLVTGANRHLADARVLLAGPKPRPKVVPEGPLSAEAQVNRFRSESSPEAVQLASVLAAVPVDVPTAQALQADLALGSGPEHLAEVLTSGLLSPVELSNWDEVRFSLPGDIRSHLLAGARRSQTVEAVRLAAARFGHRDSSLVLLRDALSNPDTTPLPEHPDEIEHQLAVMRALSGKYADRADRLGSTRVPTPKSDSLPAPPTLGNHTGDADPSRESDKMPETAQAQADPPSPNAPHLIPQVQAALAEAPRAGDARAGSPQPSDTATPLIWGTVPPRNPNFTGRVELLSQLSASLTPGGATAILPAALHGMGGIGKTQMAVEYIYRRLHDYDVVWWIQATQAPQIRASLTELAQYMGLPGSQEAHTAVPAVLEALRLGVKYRRWLLVFDSAESPELVRPFFPANGPGEILITSRNPDWAGIARPLEVMVFEREESIELLRRRGPEIENEDADRLAEKLGDLPLAIEQAAAWRAVTGMPVAEYLRLFDEKVTEILDTSPATGYDLSVAAAWNVSFDELKKRNAAAHRLLQVCAFFAPEPISRDLFSGVRGVTISPELDAALRDPMQLSRAIRDINQYGLAKIDHRSNTLLLHRLVQAVLRDRMTPQRRADMRHGAHVLLANLDPKDPVQTKQWPRYQEILPHIESAGIVECDDPWVRQLVINLGRFLYFWGDHQEAASLLKTALDTWSRTLGEKDQHSLQAASFLGQTLWALGRYKEAADLNERTLAIRKQVSGENSDDTIIAELRVAVDMKARGEFLQAREINERIFKKAKGLFGDDDPTTLQTAHDFAVTLRLCGEYRDAFDLDERTYQLRAEVLGPDSASTLNTLSGLIIDRQELGDYPRARTEHEMVADRVTALLGTEKADTLRRYGYLAVARRKDGAHDEALALSGETLRLSTQRYGDDHPNTMAAAIAHSIDLRHDGQLEKARALGEKTYDRYRRNQGENHPHTLAAAIDLAVTMRLQGEPDGARQLTERSLEQFRQALGPDHPHSVIAMINLASDSAAMNQAETAAALGTEALERSRRILGENHPTTLAASLNLSFDKDELGAADEAKALFEDTVARYRKVLTGDHRATSKAASRVRADCDIDPLPN